MQAANKLDSFDARNRILKGPVVDYPSAPDSTCLSTRIFTEPDKCHQIGQFDTVTLYILRAIPDWIKIHSP